MHRKSVAVPCGAGPDPVHVTFQIAGADRTAGTCRGAMDMSYFPLQLRIRAQF